MHQLNKVGLPAPEKGKGDVKGRELAPEIVWVDDYHRPLRSFFVVLRPGVHQIVLVTRLDF